MTNKEALEIVLRLAEWAMEGTAGRLETLRETKQAIDRVRELINDRYIAQDEPSFSDIKRQITPASTLVRITDQLGTTRMTTITSDGTELPNDCN